MKANNETGSMAVVSEPSTINHQLSTGKGPVGPATGTDGSTGRDYSSVASGQAAAAFEENISIINERWSEAQALSARIKTDIPRLFNVMVDIGRALTLCAGPRHEQLTFNLAGFGFYHDRIEPRLNGLPVAIAQSCVGLHRMKPDGFKEEEVHALIKAPVLRTALGLMLPEREPQLPHMAPSLYDEVVRTLKGVDADMAKMFSTAPLEAWPKEDLETFCRTAKPVHERYVAAQEKLRGAVEG